MNEFIPINTSRTEAPIDPQTRIGHVHLKVSDLAHSISFYTDILGFEITGRLGTQAAFLSAGGYHHHIGLNTWESAGGSPPPATSTGLYHFAVLVPTREELARALKRLVKHEWPIDGMSDHGVSEAIYLKDPDGNGIEISADRPVEKWPLDSEGNFRMYTRPLDYDSLLSELKEWHNPFNRNRVIQEQCRVGKIPQKSFGNRRSLFLNLYW